MKLAIPENAYNRVETQKDDARRAVEMVRSWSIHTSEDYEKASSFLREIKGKQKEFKSEKDALVKPLRDVINNITDLFAAPLGMLLEAEMHLKDELKRYQDETAKMHEKMLTDAQTPQEVAAAVDVLVDKQEGITERVMWSYEVVDIEKVPKEYFILDEKRISREVRQHKDELSIPGIKAVRDTTIVVRSK